MIFRFRRRNRFLGGENLLDIVNQTRILAGHHRCILPDEALVEEPTGNRLTIAALDRLQVFAIDSGPGRNFVQGQTAFVPRTAQDLPYGLHTIPTLTGIITTWQITKGGASRSWW